MKNKKLSYVLVPMVIAVWGFIFFRIFSTVENNNQASILTTKKSNNPIKFINNDTLKLALNYEDPFLKKSASSESDNFSFKTSTSRPVMPKYTIPAPIKIINWPEIKYFGSIKNIKKNKEFATISIKDKRYYLSKTDEVAGVKIVDIFKDSVVIEYEYDKKCIKK